MIAPNPSPWRRRIWLLLLLVGIAAGVFFWLGRPKPLAVLVHEVTRGPVEASVVNTRAGTVEACQRTKLSTTMGGRIEFLGVKEGDRVEKGQLLMKLWNDDQRAAQVVTEAQRESAQRRVKEVCTAAAAATREAERQSALRAKGFISEAREDAARSEAETRRAGCETAKADVMQADARIKLSRAEQGRTVLYAPFAGTVAKIVGELGEYSTPSPPGVPTPPASDLIDESCLYVKAPMDEVDAPKIRPGLSARITLDALPGKPMPGRVKRVAPYVSAVEKQARTVDVDVDFADANYSGGGTAVLLVGYSADVEIVLDTHADTVRVPTAALLEGSKVLLLGADGLLVDRKVKPGLANWEYTEIVDGLAAGDLVVTSLDRPGVKAGALAAREEKK